jgi:hypothetical protein
MQIIVWLGILASSVTLLCITAVYYQPRQPDYSMGKGSIALLCATLAIALLQWPGIPLHFPMVFNAQGALALVRNVALFALVVADLV